MWSLCVSAPVLVRLSLSLSVFGVELATFHIKLGRKIEYDDNLLKAYKAAYAADLAREHIISTALLHGKFLV